MTAADGGVGDTRTLQRPDGALLHAVLDAIPARVAVIDRDLRYIFINQEFLRFTDRPAEQVVGHTVEEVVGTAALDRVRPFISRVFAGEIGRWEGWLTYATGATRYVQQVYTPYRIGSGGVEAFFAFTRDLTDLKLRERELAERLEALRASEAMYSAVIASSLDCVVVVDEDGRVVEFNPAAEATFGYQRAEALGRSVVDLIIPPEMRDRDGAAIRTYLETGQGELVGRRVEIEAMRADGTRLPVEFAVTEVRLPERRLFTTHLRDLTLAQRAAAEIEQHREALHQSEKLAALGSLLAGVAHELNNPLSIVIGQAVMLSETAGAIESADPALGEIAERGDKIRTAAERCARIVRTFLTMARQRKAERREVAVGEVIEGAVELLAYGLRASGIEVEPDVAPGLPTIWADGDQLHQVLVNLLINARQALEDRPPPRHVRIVARHDRPAAELVVTVSDNGPGVDETIRRRIFDPFFTTKPQGIGTGIGLAVSRGLVEAHGGHLSLAPAVPGLQGASFTLRLPTDRPDAARDAARPGAASGAAGGPRNLKALVVDDEPDLAKLMADILRRRGFDCDLASSGREAQAYFAAGEPRYDVVLCDLRMPDIDGPAFYQWLRGEQPALANRVVFVTGDTLGPSAVRFLAEAGCPVVEKPFVPDEIWRAIDARLGRAR